MSEIEAAEGFAERLLASCDYLDRHYLVRARRLAAALYLAVDGSEADAKAVMLEPTDTIVARLRNSAVTLAITEGLSLDLMVEPERASILAMLRAAAR